MTENEISYQIRGAIYEVYNELGAGLLESVYQNALEIELNDRGLFVRKEVPVPVYYKGRKMDLGFRLDLLVENKVIIEVKSIANITDVHHKIILTYLKITEIMLGILVNFNVGNINEGIFRKVNGLYERSLPHANGIRLHLRESASSAGNYFPHIALITQIRDYYQLQESVGYSALNHQIPNHHIPRITKTPSAV